MTQDFKGKTITVFGGTGFVGRYVVAQLAEAGAVVKVVTRHAQSAYFLRSFGEVGQIVPVSARYESLTEIENLVKGSYAVVNCLGTLYDGKGRGSFTHIHTDIPTWIAKGCAKFGVVRFIHISALGVDASKSEYAISKFSGENLAREVFPALTILRPSVIFGAEDNFFNRFAQLSGVLPFLPLIGGGKTKFQPVYVVDVAKAVVHSLGDIRSMGQIFELGGTEVLSFKQIYERLGTYIKRDIRTVNLPWWLARVQAGLMSILPTPPLTNDQITALKTDNVVGDNAYGFKELGVTPTSMRAIVPTYLGYASYTGRKG